MRADVITPFPICKEDNDDVDDVYRSDNGGASIAAILATNRLAVTAATTAITLFGIESDYISYHSLVKLMNLFPLWVSYADYYSSVRFSVI